MRIAAHLVMAAGLIGVAQAQSSAARVDLSPLPHVLPAIMTDPMPLSGAMLRPLTEPARNARVSAAAQETTGSISADQVDAGSGDSPIEGTAVAQVEKPAAAAAPVREPAAAEAAVPEPEPDTPADTGVAAAPPAPPAVTPDPDVTTVNVIVENVESSEGTVAVALCDKGLSNEGCPYHSEVPAAAGFVETKFSDIPPGNYAVVGYHDVNRNDEFDKMLGVPREPYALSNNAGAKMVPTFKDAALKINKGENFVVIKLQRLLGG